MSVFSAASKEPIPNCILQPLYHRHDSTFTQRRSPSQYKRHLLFPRQHRLRDPLSQQSVESENGIAALGTLSLDRLSRICSDGMNSQLFLSSILGANSQTPI